MNLVRSELLKIRTTKAWWILALTTLPLWALTLFFNYLRTEAVLDPSAVGAPPPEDVATVRAAEQVSYAAANLYTNGQFLGVLIVMLLGVVVVTNEFFHQTATTTFLTTPRRTAVVLAKLAAAALLGVFFWLLTTALNLLTAPLILGGAGAGPQLDDGAVWRSIGLNGLAYLLWAIFGVGFGILIRSQVGATITAIGLYFAGWLGAALVFEALASRFGDWIDNLQVLVPSLASQLMVAGAELPGSPPRWVGAAVLVGYAAAAGLLGTMIIRRRDIS